MTICGLCGHEMTLASCGSAWADGVPLCHTDSHSCYHRWTVYGTRPTPPRDITAEHFDPRGENEINNNERT